MASVLANNPGRLPAVHWAPWLGMTPIQPDPNLARFVSLEYGIRAIAQTLLAYQDARRSGDPERLDRILKVMEPWNKLPGFVPHRMDFQEYGTLKRTVSQIIFLDYDPEDAEVHDAVIAQAIVMAGVVPPTAPPANRTTWQTWAGRIATYMAGASFATILVQLGQFVDVLQPYSNLLYVKDILPYVTLGLSILSFLAKQAALIRGTP